MLSSRAPMWVGSALVGFIFWILLITAGACLIRSFRDTESGAGLPADPSSSLAGKTVTGPTPPRDEAGARPLHGQVAQTDHASRQSAGVSERSESPAPNQGGDAGSTPALAATLQLYEYAEPSAADIYWLTVELWSQPEFLELTEDEAHELIPLDDTLGMKGPGSILALVGGSLPTEEDCERGFASEAVQDALQEVLIWETLLSELGSIQVHQRSHWAAQRLQESIRTRDEAMLDLMRLLEERTAYPNWRLLWRLHKEWAR